MLRRIKGGEYERHDGHVRYLRQRDGWEAVSTLTGGKEKFPTLRAARKATAGDCYYRAGMLALDLLAQGEAGVFVCHGIVSGTGSMRGISFGHGWVEMVDEALAKTEAERLAQAFGPAARLQVEKVAREMATTVLDHSNGKEQKVPAVLYYAFGQVRQEAVWRYPAAEYQRRVLESRRWGPWDLPEGTL